MTRDSTLFAKNDVFCQTGYQPASSERHNMIPHSETLHAWAEPGMPWQLIRTTRDVECAR
jgi:hypothetical protein